jgi:hypothetical protein
MSNPKGKCHSEKMDLAQRAQQKESLPQMKPRPKQSKADNQSEILFPVRL